MIVVMRHGASQDQIDEVSARLVELGYQTNAIVGVEKTIVGAVGNDEGDKLDAAEGLKGFPGVEDVILITKPYKFVAREARGATTVIDLGDGVTVGGAEVCVMAGPCTVEGEEMLFRTAKAVAEAGAKVLRGGAYKPCTSPYSFQGMGLEGLRLLRAAADAHGLKVVTEVMHTRKVEEVAEYADILQIGTRNMQNYELLREVGLSRTPAMLKRGMTAKFEEWLLAAEYIASAGNERIMLCERGVRTAETYTRNTLDLSAVPAVHGLSHLPVVIDPSQGTGRRELVPAMCRAAVAAGADGLLIEVHPDPDHALKDGAQSVSIESFVDTMPSLAKIADAVGRSLPLPAFAHSA